MKFSHGAWQWRKGVTPTCVRRVCEHSTDGNALIVCALDRQVVQPVDRFEGLVLQLRITSPMPDVIRVQIQHHASGARGRPKFDLDYQLASNQVHIREEIDYLVFTSGQLSLRIRKSNWEMSFVEEGRSSDPGARRITGGGHDSLGHMHVDGPEGGDFLMQRLSMGVGECIYGMGERFGPLTKNGQTVSIWNEDGGTSSDLSYKNIPFYLSSRGYGLLVNTPGKVEFEVGTERVMDVQFSVADEELDYYVFYGPQPKDVLDKYTRLAGRPTVPPPWSFGLWLSTSFTTKYDEKTVNEFIDGMIERGIPLKVFHFDCFWMKERHWCDFEWDSAAFPDPQGMLQRLKARGLKICVWINPYISAMSSIFAEGRDNGYFLKKGDASLFQRDQWQPAMAIVDFTNPDAVRWYQSKLRKLLEMGVDCFKTDFGERIPVDDVKYHDGSDPKLMHNYYAHLYNKAVFDLLEDFHGKGDATVFARAATAGCQKFPVHWGGDCEATFESMAEDLRGGLSFCLSGPAFWSHDIGGFTGTADPALYKRWVAFGLLSTHSRLHGSSSYRVPWLFDEESVTVMRHFARLKNRLIPYLMSVAHEANEKGWPAMRAMMLEYPDDPACLHLDRQYMLGSSLLVAPIFRADSVAEYYLPRGRWTNFLTAKSTEGGQWRRETLDFMHVPLFVRENSILPLGSNEDQPRWTFADELTLHLFQIADGADLPLTTFDTESRAATTIHCRRAGERIVLSGDGRAKNIKLLLRAANQIGGITNGTLLKETAEGLLLEWTDTANPITLDSPGRQVPKLETILPHTEGRAVARRR